MYQHTLFFTYSNSLMDAYRHVPVATISAPVVFAFRDSLFDEINTSEEIEKLHETLRKDNYDYVGHYWTVESIKNENNETKSTKE